jgi:hypothetical protein
MRMRLTRYPLLWLYRADVLLFILIGYMSIVGSSFVFFYKASNQVIMQKVHSLVTKSLKS